MGKSLEEVMKKMQLEQEQRIQARNAEEQKVAMIAEQQRKQWTERNRMYEKSSLSNSAASSAAAGAGAGGNNKATNFLLFNFNTFEIGILQKDRTIANTAVQPFNGITSIAKCDDDPNFLYFVTMDEPGLTFGKINKRTLQRTDIDTSNLRGLTNDTPCSLVYKGGGEFYFVDSFVSNDDDDYSEVFIITTEGEAQSIGEFDHGSQWPQALFNYNNLWYLSSLEGAFISALYTADMDNFTQDLVDYFSMKVETLPQGITNTKVWYVLDSVVSDGRIFVCVVFTDKDDGATPYQCVGELDMNDQTISYLYGIPNDYFTNIYTSIDII